MIEKAKRGVKINIPSDWVSLIRNSRPNNPFEVQEMSQDTIFLVRQLTSVIVKPRSLRFSDVTAFRILKSIPNKIYTKISHEPGTSWEEHDLILRLPLDQIKNYTFLQKHTNLIPISDKKRKDLHEMCAFLLPEYRSFYLNL